MAVNVNHSVQMVCIEKNSLYEKCQNMEGGGLGRHPFFFLVGGIFSLIIAMGIGRFAYTPLLPSMQHALSLNAMKLRSQKAIIKHSKRLKLIRTMN